MKNNEFIFKMYEAGILQDFDFIYFEFYQQTNSIKLIDEEYCFKGKFEDFVKHLKYFGFKFKDFNLKCRNTTWKIVYTTNSKKGKQWD